MREFNASLVVDTTCYVLLNAVSPDDDLAGRQHLWARDITPLCWINGVQSSNLTSRSPPSPHWRRIPHSTTARLFSRAHHKDETTMMKKKPTNKPDWVGTSQKLRKRSPRRTLQQSHLKPLCDGKMSMWQTRYLSSACPHKVWERMSA